MDTQNNKDIIGQFKCQVEKIRYFPDDKRLSIQFKILSHPYTGKYIFKNYHAKTKKSRSLAKEEFFNIFGIVDFKDIYNAEGQIVKIKTYFNDHGYRQVQFLCPYSSNSIHWTEEQKDSFNWVNDLLDTIEKNPDSVLEKC